MTTNWWHACGPETLQESHPAPTFVLKAYPPDSSGLYLCELFVQTGARRLKLDDLIQCDTTMGAALEWPPGTRDFAAGRWAGLRKWYALVPDSVGWTVMQRLDAPDMARPQWHVYARLDAQGALVAPPHQPDQLVGFYAAVEADTTYVLFLGMSGGLLEGRLFRLDTLPDPRRFHKMLGRERPEAVDVVRLYPWEGICQSSLGPCTVEVLPSGSRRITFQTPSGLRIFQSVPD